MFFPKSFKVSLQALLGLSLLAPAAYSQAVIGDNLIADNKYVQTYSAGKRTESRNAQAEKKKEEAAKETEADTKSDGSTKSTAQADSKKKPKIAMIVGPIQYTSKTGNAWQKFSGFINLKPGQEDLPLKFTILNGSGDTTPLRAIRATLSGRQLLTEKDFKGKNKLSIDLSGALTPGATQIIFTVYGNKGSSFKWQITSSAMPVITAIEPVKAQMDKDLTAKGKNLPLESSAIQVSIDNKLAKISDTKHDSFKFKIPDKVKPGKNKKVTISILGKKVKEFKIEIQSAPEIVSLSHIGIAGVQVLTIYGKNFSNKASEVEVTFNGIKGTVIGCTEQNINVQTPDFVNIPAVQSISVKVNGIDCKKAAKVMGTMRNIPNSDGYSPFEIPSQLL